MKSIHLSTDLLNYEDCAKNNCLIDRKSQNLKNYPYTISPAEVHKKLITGGLYDKAELFKSPLFNLGEKLEYEGDFGEIIFSGDARKVDLRWWSCDYFFEQMYRLERKRLPHGDSQHPKVLRFENEIEFLNLEDFPIDNYTIYINNYCENVEVRGIKEDKKGHLFFRAPKSNNEQADGKLVKLTTAYSECKWYSPSKYFWSKPIILHSGAVTYVEEIELNCYESHQNMGSRLYLIGLVPKEMSEKDKHFFYEGIPYVEVWENMDFVVNKLKQAGWHLN